MLVWYRRKSKSLLLPRCVSMCVLSMYSKSLCQNACCAALFNMFALDSTWHRRPDDFCAVVIAWKKHGELEISHIFSLVPEQMHEQYVLMIEFTHQPTFKSLAVTSLYEHDCLLSTLNKENLKHFINSLAVIMWHLFEISVVQLSAESDEACFEQRKRHYRSEGSVFCFCSLLIRS